MVSLHSLPPRTAASQQGELRVLDEGWAFAAGEVFLRREVVGLDSGTRLTGGVCRSHSQTCGHLLSLVGQAP